jgi:hypothetical protein
MPSVVRIRIQLGDVDTRIAAIGARVQHLEPFFEGPVDRELRAMWREMFASEGRSTGTPWASLSPATLALKARVHRDRMGILRRENVLYRSLVNRSDVAGIRVIGPRNAQWGTSVPYARRHQRGWLMDQMFGQPRAPRSILPRKIIPPTLPPRTQRAIETAAVAYLRDGTA